MNEYLQNVNEMTLEEIHGLYEAGYEIVIKAGVITDVLHR